MLYLPRAFHLSMSAPNARRGGQNAKASPTRSLTALAEVSWESLTVRHVEPVTRANEPDPDGAKQASRKAGKHNEVYNAGLGATVAASGPAPAFMKAGSLRLRRLAARFVCPVRQEPAWRGVLHCRREFQESMGAGL
jgi:hypothetical protein